MKKSCKGCKALSASVCVLHHKIIASKLVLGVAVGFAPVEECEKPKTYNELIEIIQNRNKER